MKQLMLLLISWLSIVLPCVKAQTIEIDFVEVDKRKIVVHYTLTDMTNSHRLFMVQLYSSVDNYLMPLKNTSGDCGTEVTPGADKKIIWEITKELQGFKGEIAFELRGRIYVPFVRLKDAESFTQFKRGKNYSLNWASGNLNGLIHLELLDAKENRIWGENNIPNIGRYDLYIPGHIKAGKNYKLKFTNARDRNDIVYSPEFSIRHKYSTLSKTAGLATLFAAILVFTQDRGTNTPGPAPYPAPDAPPGN